MPFSCLQLSKKSVEVGSAPVLGEQAVFDSDDIEARHLHLEPRGVETMKRTPVGAAERKAEGHSVGLGDHVLDDDSDIGEGRAKAFEPLSLSLRREGRRKGPDVTAIVAGQKAEGCFDVAPLPYLCEVAADKPLVVFDRQFSPCPADLHHSSIPSSPSMSRRVWPWRLVPLQRVLFRSGDEDG